MVNIRASRHMRSSGSSREYPAAPKICNALFVVLIAISAAKIFARAAFVASGNPSFDFTLYNVKGSDEGGISFETAPQFSYTIGYYFTKKGFGLEYQYDHIKYFVRQGQRVHMRGFISGHSLDQDTLLNPAFFQLEHSDGGNYAMVNLVKWMPIRMRHSFIYPELVIKAGFGVVHPKTNSSILGYWRDDRYHFAGLVTGLESGIRARFGKWFFVYGGFKGVYANYRDFLIAGGHGSQQWLSLQFNYLVGAQFPL